MSQALPNCTFFKAGHCQYGKKCRFAHNSSSSQANAMPVSLSLPGAAAAKAKAATAAPIREGKIPLPCKYFKNGCCQVGASCRYSHAEDLKMPTQAGSIHVLCKYFADGYCSDGRMCIFLHDRNLLEAKEAKQVVNARGQVIRNVKSMPSSLSTKKNANQSKALESKPTMMSSEADTTDTKVHIQETLDVGEEEKNPRTFVVLSKNTTPVREITNEHAWQSQEDGPKLMEDLNLECKHESIDALQKQQWIQSDEEAFFYGAPGVFEDKYMEEGNEKGQGRMIKPAYKDVLGIDVEKVDVQPDALFSPSGDVHASDVGKQNPKKASCLFFQQGYCRFGNRCLNWHAPLPNGEQERALLEQELEASKELECNICFENVLEKGERFGVLSGCNHSFCLSCVRNWRDNSHNQPSEAVRMCPVCRLETFFVIPMNRMVIHPERKAKMIKEYQSSLAHIPCRYFDQGRGTCPFGTSCFYAHLLPDGTVQQDVIRTAVDAQGNYDVLKEIRLDAFIKR